MAKHFVFSTILKLCILVNYQKSITNYIMSVILFIKFVIDAGLVDNKLQAKRHLEDKSLYALLPIHD